MGTALQQLIRTGNHLDENTSVRDHACSPSPAPQIFSGPASDFGDGSGIDGTVRSACRCGHGPDDSTMALQEVIVTATRREVSAQDLPISITAVTGNELEQAGIEDVGALAHSMAGVDFTDKGPFSGIAGANLIIRGLNSDNTGWLPGEATPVVPAVATYVDDTPCSSTCGWRILTVSRCCADPKAHCTAPAHSAARFATCRTPGPRGLRCQSQRGDERYRSYRRAERRSARHDQHSGIDTIAIRANGSWTYDAGYINQPNLYALNSAGDPIAAQPGNLSVRRSSTTRPTPTTTNITPHASPRCGSRAIPSMRSLSYFYQLGTAGGFPYIATNPLAYTQPISH
jgi:hypothetical protein